MLVPGKLSSPAPGSLPAKPGIAHHTPVLMKWPWQLQERVQAPQPSSAPPWCPAGVGEDHYFTIWNAKQMCFNWIQSWSQYWFKLEDSLCVSVHRGKIYLDEEESVTASQGRIILVISDACQTALPGIIDEGDKLISWLPFLKVNALI